MDRHEVNTKECAPKDIWHYLKLCLKRCQQTWTVTKKKTLISCCGHLMYPLKIPTVKQPFFNLIKSDIDFWSELVASHPDAQGWCLMDLQCKALYGSIRGRSEDRGLAKGISPRKPEYRARLKLRTNRVPN